METATTPISLHSGGATIAPAPTERTPAVTLVTALKWLAFLGAVLVSGRISLAVESRAGISVVPLWLPSGVGLAGFFLLGLPAIPIYWLGAFLTSVSARSPEIAVVFASGDVLSALLGWWLLSRVAKFDREFRSGRDVVLFVFYGAVLSTLAGASIGIFSQTIPGILAWRMVPRVFGIWWLGNISGVLAAAPLLLRWKRSWWKDLWNLGRGWEAVAAYSAILLLFPLLGRGGEWQAWKLFSWPLLLWAALRLGPFGAPSAAFLLTIGTVLEFLQAVHVDRAASQRFLWDQWAETMSLSIAGLVVMALEAARVRTDQEREKLQAELAQAQKMESIGRLAGGVAHDFNNLLTVINGRSQLALRQLSSGRQMGGDAMQATYEEILKAGQQAAALTQRLLAFSRKQILKTELCDLNAVVEGMGTIVDRLMGAEVEIRTQLSSLPATVMIDGHQIEQVILNLAVNARDAMPCGGVLSIQTQVLEGWDVLLSVTDTGVGMDETVREHIFEPFFTTRGAGTGLGLSMVQGVVEQSGGRIEVESAPQMGTTFRVLLPYAAAQPAARTEPVEAPRTNAGHTILVAEDRDEVRDYAMEVLKGYGYRVIGAANTEEALLSFKANGEAIDLVLTDVVMPSIGGIDLASRVRVQRPEVKIVFMSGYPDDGRPGKTLPPGSDCLRKPFSPKELAEVVWKALGG
jgi:signal transduction histidine kinase